MKFKSIKTKLICTVTCVFMLVTVILSAVSAYAAYQSTMHSLESTMTQAAKLSAANVEKQILMINKLMTEMASSPYLTDSAYSSAEKVRFLEDKALQYPEYKCFVTFAGKDARDIVTGVDVSERQYYTDALQGKATLSDPLNREDTGALGFTYAVPVKSGGSIIGALLMVFDYQVIYDIIGQSAIGQTGTAYVISSGGDTIISEDQQKAAGRYNAGQEALKDQSLEKLAGLERAAAQGGNGFGSFTASDGAGKVLSYAPISGTDGWALLTAADSNEFMSWLYNAIALCVGCCIAIAVLSIAVMVWVANGIANPIKRCADRLSLLARGDLRAPVPDIRSSDETGVLAGSTKEIAGVLSGIMEDLSYNLHEFGNGNFRQESGMKDAYIGDFLPLLTSMDEISERLSDALSQIGQASDQVASGSGQVSSGAQALSQGATEQASSIEELSATILGISERVNKNAENAGSAKREIEKVGGEITQSNQKMRDMTAAMNGISEKSSRIGGIIKTIDDIAFQTNILALNAAVEAARAGAAGKGFAVVADEVRNLAAKSAEAARDTAALIQETIDAVGNGTKMADDTARSILSVVEGAKAVTSLMNEIAEASGEQAESVKQVTQGVDQISSVVQTNSATAEESAAASEELSSQAQMFKQLVGRFKLKESARSGLL